MFQPTEIHQINYCRLYLQAVTVSDISTASGSRLFCGIHKGSTTGITSTTTWHHTVQKKTDTSSWKLWKKALAIFSTNGILHNPMYEWLHPPTQQRRKWTSYFDPQTNYLLFPCDEQYTVHFRCNQIYGIEPGGTQTTLSEKSYPVDIRRTFDGWHIAKYSKILPPPPTPLSTTFHEYCSNLEPWESNLLTNASLNFPPEEKMLYLSTQAFRACSDGSAVSLQGTFGWVLALPDKTRLAFGAGPVDGHDPNSFWAEGQGMLSIVCFLKRLREWTKSSVPISGVLATDNSPLLDRVREQSSVKYPIPNATFKSDWDVVEAIVRNVADANITPDYRHVKGHQDKEVEYSKLPFLSQLNVDADKYAGIYQTRYGSHRPIILLSPTRPIALDIDGKTGNRHLKATIRESAHYQPLMNRLKVRHGWGDHVPDTIDWEAHRLATNGAQPNRRCHFVKLCHGYLPAGKIAHRNKNSHPDWCPLCKQPNEDHQHIL